MKRDEVGWACGTDGAEKKMRTWFWWENLKRRGRFKNQRVDGVIILKLILRKWEGKAWI
jgi:hypothetical protein